MDIKRKFGEKVRQLRLAKNISQEALALEANIDRTYLFEIAYEANLNQALLCLLQHVDNIANCHYFCIIRFINRIKSKKTITANK